MSPSDLQLDALREVANIGGGHAVSALSQLLGKQKVKLDLPQALLASTDAVVRILGGPQQPVVGTLLGIDGDMSGQLLLCFSREDARRLASQLLAKPQGEVLSEDARSSIAETGNIVASAFLNAMGKLGGMRLMPSVPRLLEQSAQELAQAAFSATRAGASLLIVLEARFFTSAAPPVTGQFLVLTEESSLAPLFKRLKVSG